MKLYFFRLGAAGGFVSLVGVGEPVGLGVPIGAGVKVGRVLVGVFAGAGVCLGRLVRLAETVCAASVPAWASRGKVSDVESAGKLQALKPKARRNCRRSVVFFMGG